MLTIILAAIQKFLLGLISLAALIAIIVGVISGHPPGNPPTAASASITTLEDATSAPVTPSVSDPDAGETFTFSIASQPANGSAAVVGNQLVYTPDANFNGQDSFSFRATDSGGLSAVAAANVTVAPVADAPSATHAGITARTATPGTAVTPFVEDADLWETFSHQLLS